MQHSKRKPMAQINMVPFIDVMLVLLIIFMVTAPMLTQGEKVDLPDVESDPLPINEISDHIIVSINNKSEYFIERPDREPFKEDLPYIGAHIKKIVEQNPEILVLVRADENINYGVVMRLVDTLKKSGAVSVGLATEDPAQ